MPVIPSYDASEKLDTAKMPTVDFDTSAQQAAARQGGMIQTIGNQLTAEASRWQQMEDQREQFSTRANLDRWQQTIEREDNEALAKMPENGQGFTQERLKNFDQKANDFLSTVPPKLRGEYAQRAGMLRERMHNDYAVKETAQLAKFSVSEVSTAYEKSKIALLNNPQELDLRKADLADRIRTAPGIPERSKPALLKQYSRDLEDAAAGKLHEADPEGMARLAGIKYDAGSSLERRLVNKESGGRPGIINGFGFAGLYQFGAPRLQTMGVYTPGPNEDLKGWNESSKLAPGKWTGTFSIPGHPEVKTISDFLSSREAQKTAFQIHAKEIEGQISARGLTEFIGKTIGSVEITKDGIIAMAHLGGIGGAEKALRGQGNAADANGSTVLSYARLGVGTASDASQPAPTTDPRFSNLTGPTTGSV